MANHRQKYHDHADMCAYARLVAEDNSQTLASIQTYLLQAIEEELTPRQQEMLLLYYHEKLTMREIAQQLGLHHSTVSRTLHRAEAHLRRCLRYGAASFLRQDD